jgi:hypothetical protein
VSSQEVAFAPSTPYASRDDLIVRHQNSDFEEMSASNDREPNVAIPCQSTNHDCMHTLPIQPSPATEVQEPLEIEVCEPRLSSHEGALNERQLM